MKYLAFLSIILFVASCNDITVVSTYDTFYLTPAQIEKNERLVEKGDSNAAFTLYRYYTFCTDNRKTAIFWLEKSAALGNETAKGNLLIEYELQNNTFDD